ncbi:MAG TPA: phosphoglycerate kinase [Candidatus Bathyarchaeia archaeon]|nr:phosphoglycerate kinase [Candidatus Bathyarchaeia archaeon]
MPLIHRIPSWNVSGKRVLLRADLNIKLPVQKDDFRLISLLPTVDFLVEHNAIVILLTHRGRPKHPDPALSTASLVDWFVDHQYTARFAPDLATLAAAKKSALPGHLIVFENLRFFPGEQANDPAFAHALARDTDFYVNDAFGSLHRPDCSLTTLARLFPPENRSIGFLVKKELTHIDAIMAHAQYPLVLISGGGKMHEKLVYLDLLVQHFDIFCVCPELALAFLHAKKYETGHSSCNEKSDQLSTRISIKIYNAQKKLYLPSDYQVAFEGINGPLKNVGQHAIAKNSYCTSIGPETITLFTHIIQKAGTIIGNGFPGFENRTETMEASHALIHAIEKSSAKTIIGGGDTGNMVYQMHISSPHLFLSTGGGSLLAYIAQQKLSALELLLDSTSI